LTTHSFRFRLNHEHSRQKPIIHCARHQAFINYEYDENYPPCRLLSLNISCGQSSTGIQTSTQPKTVSLPETVNEPVTVNAIELTSFDDWIGKMQ
jgi:hypothetical protein